MFLTILDVVNTLLGTLGEAPLNSLDDVHPMLAAAKRVIEQVDYQEQSRGWWFNKEIVSLPTDASSGFVYTPADAIRVSPLAPCAHYVQRGRRLYDPQNATYTIAGPVNAFLIRKIPFEDLPPSAQSYITAACSVRFQTEFDGDQLKGAALRADNTDSYAIPFAEHQRNERANLLRNPGVASLLAQQGAQAYVGLPGPQWRTMP